MYYLTTYPSKFTDAKAIDLLNSCLVLNPGYRDTFVEWVRILNYRSNHRFARKILAYEVHHGPESVSMLAHLSMQLRLLAKRAPGPILKQMWTTGAESRACEAFAKDPQDLTARLALAAICLDQGDSKGARELIELCEKSDFNADYFDILASLYEAEGKHTLAAESLWQAICSSKSREHMRAVVHYSLRLRDEYPLSSRTPAAQREIDDYLAWREQHEKEYFVTTDGERLSLAAQRGNPSAK